MYINIIIFRKYLFVYLSYLFCLHWVIIAASRLSLVVMSKGYPLVVVHVILTVVASLVSEH